jgi:hypothetical protein
VRAIARKRNAYGMALGDILLPEGRTVEAVVEEAIAAAFREAGYRVLAANEAESRDLPAVEADIEKFWAWFSPGFWTITTNFETVVRITAPVAGLESGESIAGGAQTSGMAATSGMWMKTVDAGVQNFSANLRSRLAAGPSPVGASGREKQVGTSDAKSAVPERLRILEQLKADGLLSDEEYGAKRQQILDGL